MATAIQVFPDDNLIKKFCKDPSYKKERDIVSFASKSPKLLGKIAYGLNYPQAMVWSREKRLAMKMSTVYLTAKEFLIDSGIPKGLLDVSAIMFDDLGGSPVTEKLRRSVRFICVAWHARMVRVFHLLLDEFRNGKSVASYGCGSGIIELLALLASDNHNAKLTLIDVDPANIALAQDLLALFRDYYPRIDQQVTLILADIREYRLPDKIDTAISIGLLHNYFPLAQANLLMQDWFTSGATKIITDICYDPKNSKHDDADIRMNFVNVVLDWKLGPPDGLLYYSHQEFCENVQSRELCVYDHGLNATIVVT